MGFIDLPPYIQAQITEFRSQNQNIQQQRYTPQGDLNIGHLRSDTNLKNAVNSGIEIVREQIPSLSNGSGPRVQFQDQLYNNSGEIGQYEWVSDNDGNKHLVQRQQASSTFIQNSVQQNLAPSTPPSREELARGQAYNPRTSYPTFTTEFRCSPTTGRTWTVLVPNGHSTPEVHISRPSYRMEYKCCPKTGRVWQESVPITPPNQNVPETVMEWRIDPNSSQRYQVYVQKIPHTNLQTNGMGPEPRIVIPQGQNVGQVHTERGTMGFCPSRTLSTQRIMRQAFIPLRTRLLQVYVI